MSLFSDLSGYKVGKIKPQTVKKEKQPTLLELAEEKFGTDRKLMMWIEGFLAQKREAHIMPTRLAWIQQLAILEEWPENQRIEQIQRSITNDYRAIAYKYIGKKKLVNEYQDEDDIVYTKGF